MQVHISNIQGFKGEFSMTIGKDDITNITSDNNGTGKTTFFDCIKLLCDMTSFNKEELKFIVNKDCSTGIFIIMDDEVSYGFKCCNGVLRYLRQYKGDEPEFKSEPFLDVRDFLGVMVVDGMFINVCDRFINLFSSSSEAVNFNLVEALTTNRSLNNMLDLLNDSMIKNKELYNISKNQYEEQKLRMKGLTYYNVHDDYAELIVDDNIVIAHDNIKRIAITIDEYTQTKTRISTSILSNINRLLKLIDEVIIEKNEIDLSQLKNIDRVSSISSYIKSYEFERGVIDETLLCGLYNTMNYVVEYKSQIDFNTMQTLLNILSLVVKYKSPKDICNYETISALSEIRNKSYGVAMNYERIKSEMAGERELKESISQYKTTCELHDEVYIIDGSCYHI